MKQIQSYSLLSLIICVIMLFVSCSTLSMGPEGRAASDQLLVAVSIQDAIKQLHLEPLVKERFVTLEVVGHSTELDYINEVAKAYLMQCGAIIDDSTETVELHITLVVDSTGSDLTSGGWGIPIILPSLSTGFTVTTINFVETEEQIGLSRLWAYAINPNGQLMYTTNPTFSQHTIKNLKVLGLSLGRTSNVDELKQRIPGLEEVNIFSR